MFQQVDLDNGTKVEAILSAITESLASGKISPGDKLPSEGELARMFNVGKSSVREAVKMLDAVGVIDSVQGKGLYVCDGPRENALNPLVFSLLLLNANEEHLYDFRCFFERAYTVAALENATAEDIDLLRNALDQTEQFSTDIDRHEDFHRAVLVCTHNPYMVKFGEVLIDLLVVTFKREGEQTESNLRKSKYHHKRIFEAIRDKDITALNKVLDESFQIWREDCLCF